jgi:tyrosinase
MRKTKSPVARRSFLKTTLAAAAGAASLPITGRAFTHPPTAKYIRYNVMSQGGQKAINSYNIGIQAMLKLPATHPQNWFRNAFIHLMDCPHGNWWFYVWHRGYLGYFEETIRNLSGDSTFAMPYWDWTTLPEIPSVMFDSALTPTADAFELYTKNLDVFTSFIKPALTSYWNGLTSAQRGQLNIRGYKQFDLLWNDVTGLDPSSGNGISGNMAYAITCGARFLSRDNPKLDPATAHDCSPYIIESGLQPTAFYNPTVSLSFTSSKTPSHNTPPGQGTSFSTLEGLPHNIVHNYIGGVTKVDPGPYGNMTNFLSPVDPIFFLHHSNMDRLWDVWTRKQQSLGLPYLPTGADLQTLSNEPFLFYVNGNGQPVGTSTAGEYLSTQRFDYEYERGFPDNVLQQTSSTRAKRARLQVRGTVRGNRATLAVPADAVKEHLAAPAAALLVAEITVPHPTPSSPTREFHVLVGAPPDVTEADPSSPYYAGTIAFFGNMAHAHGTAADATFAVPLPKAVQAFAGLAAANATVNIRIVPAYGARQRTPVLKSVTIRSL